MTKNNAATGLWFAAVAATLSLVPVNASGVSGVIQVIDVSSILQRKDLGNSLGLAYNADLNVIHLSQTTAVGDKGFLYTVDLGGHLLLELDFETLYRPGFVPLSLSYERSSGHLFVVAAGSEAHLLDMSPDGATIFSDMIIEDSGAMVVRSDGLWQLRNARGIIRHYSRAGVFIEDISASNAFGSFDQALALATSFRGGFFLVDNLGGRLVEVNGGGTEIAEGMTAVLPGVAVVGRGMAIDTDLSSQRIFLQVENAQIYVLSQQFLREFVNPLVTVSGIHTSFDPTPVPNAPAGTFTISATFKNRSAHAIEHPVFVIRELAVAAPDDVVLNTDDGPGGVGHDLTPDVGADGTLSPGESFTTDFIIGLQSLTQFTFFVDLLASDVQ
jgi:hypothetical protein